MKVACSRAVWTVGLMSVSVAALASETTTASPQEPVGFVSGAVIGGLAAGPIGAVVGAGIGTWLGNRVHRAGDAKKAEAQVAMLQNDKVQLQSDKATLSAQTGDLSETNRVLSARIDQLSHNVAELSQSVEAAQSANNAEEDSQTAKVLDGLQGDVLFRTGSADLEPDMAKGISVLAEAVAKSPTLKVRVDGYADPRGSADANLKLSEARANSVRDIFLAAGVDDSALEVNAYGKSQSVAGDSDGYALERRVRLTLQAEEPNEVAQVRTGAPAAATSAGGLAPTDSLRDK